MPTLVLLALLSHASAATLDVPDSYATVQDALDAATAGDEIRIAAGSYPGDVFIDVDVAIVGAGMDVTLIANGSGDFGFTLSNGVNATVSDLTVVATTTPNAVNTNSGGSLALSRVKIRGGASTFYWGAGLRVYDSSFVTLTDSIICGNTTTGGVGGAGVYVRELGIFEARNSVFFANDSGGEGGAAFVYGDATFINNTFVANSSSRGAAVLADGTSVTIINNVVVDNSAGGQSGTQYAMEHRNSGGFDGSNNLYDNNSESDTEVSLPADVYGDPLLVNPAVTCASSTLADFALGPGSPAIGAGDPTFGDDIGAVPFTVDADNDGYPDGEDCNDNDASVHPDATEVVGDGIDQDCDGGETCYVDGDNDGARTTGEVTSADVDCNDTGEALATEPLDCNDADSGISPLVAETVGDDIDQDCDGFAECYHDDDDDGARTTATFLSSDADCADPREGRATDPLDCNDGDPAIQPGAAELVGDNVDQNCDGAEVCYLDNDDDGARSSATVTSSDADCNDAMEAVSGDPIDCNDNNAAIHPGASEFVGDNVDQDCDGAEVCFVDDDDDGARTTATRRSADTDCNDAQEGRSADPIDCNDNDAAIRPGAMELVGDGIDQDCDGSEICAIDSDNDGYRQATGTVVSADADCDDSGEGLITDGIDCLDSNAAVNPGATELVGDSFDQDCDGQELCYADADNDGFTSGATLPSVDPDCNDAGEATAADPVGDCNDADDAVHPGVA